MERHRRSVVLVVAGVGRRPTACSWWWMPARSGPAEGLLNDLIGPRRRGIAFLRGLVVVGRREHLEQLLERLEITLFNRRLDDLFDPMVAWNEGGAD